MQFYTKNSEIFKVFPYAHLAISHGGHDRMLKKLLSKYKNIICHDTEL